MAELVTYGSAIGALVVTAVVGVATWAIARLHAVIGRCSSFVANVIATLLAVITLLASHVFLQAIARWWVNRKLSRDEHLLYVWVHPGIMWTVLGVIVGVTLGYILVLVARPPDTEPSQRGVV
jgi:hypothetical protein